MEAKIKQFGPLWVGDYPQDADRAAVGKAILSRFPEYDRPHPHDVWDWGMAEGPIDDMITALREAANWLEWRKASEEF